MNSLPNSRVWLLYVWVGWWAVQRICSADPPPGRGGSSFRAVGVKNKSPGLKPPISTASSKSYSTAPHAAPPRARAGIDPSAHAALRRCAHPHDPHWPSGPQACGRSALSTRHATFASLHMTRPLPLTTRAPHRRWPSWHVGWRRHLPPCRCPCLTFRPRLPAVGRVYLAGNQRGPGEGTCKGSMRRIGDSQQHAARRWEGRRDDTRASAVCSCREEAWQ